MKNRKISDIGWWTGVLLIVATWLTILTVIVGSTLNRIEVGATASRTILCDSLLFDEQQPKVKPLAEAMVRANCFGIVLPKLPTNTPAKGK